MQAGNVFDDTAKGGLWRRLATCDGLELLDRVPLDVDRDPLLGTALSEDLIDSAADCSVGLGSAHAPKIKGLQPLYRPLNPLVAILLIALLLLARAVPVEDEPLPPVIGAPRAI